MSSATNDDSAAAGSRDAKDTQSHVSDSVRRQVEEHPRLSHYLETLDNVPAAIAAMFDMNADFAASYTDIRELIYTARDDGLPLAVKELLLVLLDLAVSNTNGALNHLRAAKRAGLTSTQLFEMLAIAFLVLGVSGWGKTGYILWREFPDLDSSHS